MNEQREQKQDKFEYLPNIPAEIVRDKRLGSGRSRELWAYLSFRCHNKGYCWSTLDQIEYDLGMSRPTISSYSKLLSKLGYITVKTNGGLYGANLYIVNDLKGMKVPPHKSKVASRKEERIKKTLEKITSQLNQGVTYPLSKDLLLSGESLVMVVVESGDVVKNLYSLREKPFTKRSKGSLLSLRRGLYYINKTPIKTKNKTIKKGTVEVADATKMADAIPPSKEKEPEKEKSKGKFSVEENEVIGERKEWFSTLVIQTSRTKDKEHMELLEKLMAQINQNDRWSEEWVDDWSVIFAHKEDDEIEEVVKFFLKTKPLLAQGVDRPFGYIWDNWDEIEAGMKEKE
jgi:hypothetical protein